ncbi:MAG: hypothetical protein AB7H97_17630, partial [Pseudobdellovibrionaceae bacterium]
EDAVELRIITFEEAQALLLDMFEPKEKDAINRQLEADLMFRTNLARIRGPVFERLIDAAITGFMNQYDDIMDNKAGVPVFNQLGNDKRAKFIQEAKDLGARKIYQDTRKIEVELGAFTTFDTLLSDLTQAAREKAKAIEQSKPDKEISWKTKSIMSLLGDHAPQVGNLPAGDDWDEYCCQRRVLDFVSGMTDNYATYIAKQLRGGGYTGQQRP